MDCNNALLEEKSFQFLEFIKLFGEREQKVLKIFKEYIVDKLSIPYKIRKKNFEVEVMSAPAFSVSLIFKNVLIEDGRHPREILITNLTGTKLKNRFRLKFINGLNNDTPVKESSFTFSQVEAVVRLWNYNFNMEDFKLNGDKMPWRILAEPILALLKKEKVLGMDYLNGTERQYFDMMRFLHKYIVLYLDDKTVIGYGKSNLNYDMQKVTKRPPDYKMIEGAKLLFKRCRIDDLTTILTDEDGSSIQFFEAFIWLITRKDGQKLFDFAASVLEQCTSVYPNIKQMLPVYANHYPTVAGTLTTIFRSRHWSGEYPHFVKQDKPRFIETFYVYERKYTYINEKEKQLFVSFIESIVDGDLVITAVRGNSLVKAKAKEQTVTNKALDCYFTDGGRRSCEIIESVTIEQEMEEDVVQDLMVQLYRSVQTS